MDVAQLVELLVVVQAVAGSNPVVHPSESPWYEADSTKLLADSAPVDLLQDLLIVFGLIT